MIKLAIYGKGGIGKSTISTHLSAAFASQGKKVLHVGCDAKADSTIKLIERKRPVTVNDLLSRTDHHHTPEPKKFIMKGMFGIDCIEAGGPEPGMGCGGRGIIAAEKERSTTIATSPRSRTSMWFQTLTEKIMGSYTIKDRRPTPLTQERFINILQK